MACYTLYNFANNHIDSKASIEMMAKHVEDKYAKPNKKDPHALKMIDSYKRFWRRKISWWDYIKANNSGEFFTNSQYDKYLVIGWLIFSRVFMAIGLSLFLHTSGLPYGDRQRGILYSYGMGKVRLTRHEDAQFGYAGKMLAIKLYGFDEKQVN